MRLGIPSAKVEHLEFEGEPAIVVERYERRRQGRCVLRVYQEGLCQTLGCLPSGKYIADGCPPCNEVARRAGRSKTSVLAVCRSLCRERGVEPFGPSGRVRTKAVFVQ